MGLISYCCYHWVIKSVITLATRINWPNSSNWPALPIQFHPTLLAKMAAKLHLKLLAERAMDWILHKPDWYTVDCQTRGKNGTQHCQHNQHERRLKNQDKLKEKQFTHCMIKGHSSYDCHCSCGVMCHKCGLVGHFASVWHTKNPQGGKKPTLIQNVNVKWAVTLLTTVGWLMRSLRFRQWQRLHRWIHLCSPRQCWYLPSTNHLDNCWSHCRLWWIM